MTVWGWCGCGWVGVADSYEDLGAMGHLGRCSNDVKVRKFSSTRMAPDGVDFLLSEARMFKKLEAVK